MAERFTADLLFIIIVLLIAAILGFLIGYLWSRSRKHSCTECEENKEKINALKLQIAELNASKVNPQPSISASTQEVKSPVKQAVKQDFNAALASNALGKKIKQDDLQIVKGIGPKISKILQKQGINAWSDLAKSHEEKIKEILLNEGGDSYHIHDPNTWPEQAQLAASGKWQQLKEFQDKVINGRLT